jgi:hypothetical protein
MTQTQTRATAEWRATATSPGRDRTAVWAVVLAILAFGGVGSVAGIVLGVRARRDGRRVGMATAAIVLGVVTLIGSVVYWVVLAQHMGGSGGGAGGSGGGGGY